MTIKRFLKLMAWCVLSVATNELMAQTATAKKPNVVFILADDLGMNDLGCYGNPFNETPNIDKLARSGILFKQAYAACPVCSPTRASILTGKYPARLQLTNFGGGTKTDPQSPVLPAQWRQYLEPKEETLGELMKQQGYATGMVGKWHLGNPDSLAPWNQGFDFTRLITKNGLDYYNYGIAIDSYKKEFVDHGTEYMTDKLTGYGVQFIKEHKQEPFFLYMAYSAPHVLLVPRGDKLGKYFKKYNKLEKSYNPNYAAVIESLDDGVGMLVETLKEQGLLENTLIVFTSDNGPLGIDELGPTPAPNEPLHKWKGHVYEGGIRIPAIISWAGNIAPGSVSNKYFSTIDYLPTLCQAAGITRLPAKIDGHSMLADLLQPTTTNNQSNPIFWHYPHFSNQLGRPAGAVRSGKFKLIENYENGKLELYNLETDPYEKNDLAVKNKAKANALHKLLVDWRKQVNAQMPLPNPAYIANTKKSK